MNTADRITTRSEFLIGFADAAGISLRKNYEVWMEFSRNMSDRERDGEEQNGYKRGVTLGMKCREDRWDAERARRERKANQ